MRHCSNCYLTDHKSNSKNCPFYKLYANFDRWYSITWTWYYLQYSFKHMFNSKHIEVVNELIHYDNALHDLAYFNFEKVLSTDKHLIVIKVALTNEQKMGHFNVLLIDKKRKVVERYEPHGSSNVFGDRNSNIHFNFVLQETFKSFGYTYIESCNYDSIQVIAGESYGLCQSIGLYYIFNRVAKMNIPSKAFCADMTTYVTRIDFDITKEIKKFICRLMLPYFLSLDNISQPAFLMYNILGDTFIKNELLHRLGDFQA